MSLNSRIVIMFPKLIYHHWLGFIYYLLVYFLTFLYPSQSEVGNGMETLKQNSFFAIEGPSFYFKKKLKF
jgi:hypothetical protein